MPPTRGHLKLGLYFLVLALAGAWCATRWMELEAARNGQGSDAIGTGVAIRVAVCCAVGCALLGFLGVLSQRMLVARARARELAQWAERVQGESRKYRALFEGSADMLLIVDPRTQVIRESNAPARERLGAPASFAELLDAAHLAGFSTALGQPGNAAPLADLQLATRDGRHLIAAARFSPIELGGEALVLVSLRDETRQREMERELAIRERLSSIGL